MRASTGFEPMTSALPVRCSTKWAMKPHIGSEVNLSSSYLPAVRSEMMWSVYEIIHFWTAVVDDPTTAVQKWIISYILHIITIIIIIINFLMLFIIVISSFLDSHFTTILFRTQEECT